MRSEHPDTNPFPHGIALLTRLLNVVRVLFSHHAYLTGKRLIRPTILLLILSMHFSLTAQTFRQFLDRIKSAPELQRPEIADSFMKATPSIPFIEQDTLVHFIFNSPSQSVAMAGDATGWRPDKEFTSIAGCTFRYFTTSYPKEARLDYKLVINGTDWILDPGNPHVCAAGFGPNSELRMPGCIPAPESRYDPGISHGTILDTTFYSSSLKNSRQVRIYLPPGYDTTTRNYPVVLFHDGPEYITLCKANNILDYLISHRLIEPVIALFVPPIDRTEEYAGGQIEAFTFFITDELMPVAEMRYRISKDPSKRSMIGASNGGNIALYIGIKKPASFGLIGAQSSNVIPIIAKTLAKEPHLTLKFYLDIGTYDLVPLIPLVRHLKDVLANKNYDVRYHEWPEGHSWGNWMGHLRFPLMQFFPYSGSRD